MRVLLVHPYPIIATALKRILSSFHDDVEIRRFDSGRAAVEMLDTLPLADIVVFTALSGSMESINHLATIGARMPAARLVLAAEGALDPAFVMEAARLGIVAALSLRKPVATTRAVLEAVTRGERQGIGQAEPRPANDAKPADPHAELTFKLTAHSWTLDQADWRGTRRLAQPVIRLTPRQREVLDLVLRGASNKTIADALALSPSTVKSHVGAVLRALDVRSRGDAARALSA